MRKLLFFSGLVELSLILPITCPAIEVATGRMLGDRFRQRSFYVRTTGGGWQETYAGPRFRPQAAGRLMNLRLAQALFHDEWLTEEPFDPERHTGRVIAALDSYMQHGVMAISVSLQGANMEYSRTSRIRRNRPAKLGPGKGSLVSAFLPDGSLKPTWMSRALRLARELDTRGMILNLIYFYAYQDEVLNGPPAIDRAVANATGWIIDNNLRNVIIEIANEHDGGDYDFDRYIDRRMDRLFQIVRARFEEKKAPFRLPVSASSVGGRKMQVSENVSRNADLVIIHGNHCTPAEKRSRVAELYANASVPGPIHMNEDNNGRETTPENLNLELASCDAVFESGGGWGYMPWVQAQIYPFGSFLPGPSPELRPGMPVEKRDLAYFKAVLEHIRKLVMK